MSLQSEIIKSLGAMGAAKGIYKASPEYSEKMRLRGLNQQEIEATNLLNQTIRTIEDPEYNADKSDINKASMLHSHISNLLEEQGKFGEALEHRKGWESLIQQLEAFVPAQKSTDSVQNARSLKAVQSDMTDNLRDFYRQVRLGGEI